MKHSVKLATCLLATLCTVLAFAQLPPTQGGAASQPSTIPSAYLYVTSNPSSNTYEINGYSAASDGTLSTIAGSPFGKTNNTLSPMANTSHWLFVSDGVYIYSFSIASTGALKRISSINAQQYDSSGGTSGYLVLDHTGTTLYNLQLDGVGDNAFEFFNKNSTTGALTYSGSSPVSAAYGSLAFIGNNVYAYGSACIQLSAAFYGFSRRSDGTLTRLSLNPPIPPNPNGNYCPTGVAADPASDVAIPFLLEGQPPVQLGVYTADSSGNLTTNSTYQNMPSTAVGFVNDMATSPSGNLLAVAGSGGLQVFHFNGSNPITPYTGLLATHNITQIRWDSHKHLYGVSPSSGRLYVFTVTSTGYKQAPGSPHSITNPKAITVLSK